MTKNYEWLTMCAAVSLSGHPAISIPCGLDASGMPFGLQLIGSKRGEIRLLQIAAALQDAFESGTEFARPIPDLEHLASFDVDFLSVVTGSADGVEATSQGTMKKETSA
jgi:hypothetical protein